MNLTILPNNFPATAMTSQEISDLVESRHDSVKLCIERLASRGTIQLPPLVEVKNHLGQTVLVYRILKRDSFVVVAQLSPEFTARLVDRWQEMEAKQAAPAPALPQDYIQALESLLASKKSEQLAIAERDHAIATKAQISDKKTATAMATASAKSREAAKLRDQLGFNTHHATVKAVLGATKKTYAWLPMRKLCEMLGIQPKDVTDPLYGTVKAWPARAWFDVHGVVLADLFGEVA